MPGDPPRRRISDRDRRRWNDKALDLLGDRVESHAEDLEELRLELRPVSRLPQEFASFRREFDEWKSERRDDVTELRKDIRELRSENRTAHKRVVRGQDPENGEQLPPPLVKVKATRLDTAKDFATIISLLIMPVLLVYLTAKLGVKP